MDRPEQATAKEKTLFDVIENLREAVYKLEGKVYQSNQGVKEELKTPPPMSKVRQAIGDLQEFTDRIREVIKNLPL